MLLVDYAQTLSSPASPISLFSTNILLHFSHREFVYIYTPNIAAITTIRLIITITIIFFVTLFSFILIQSFCFIKNYKHKLDLGS